MIAGTVEYARQVYTCGLAGALSQASDLSRAVVTSIPARGLGTTNRYNVKGIFQNVSRDPVDLLLQRDIGVALILLNR